MTVERWEPEELRAKPLRKPYWLPRDEWTKFLELHNGAPRCTRCGQTDYLSVDHIQARRWQGGDDLANLQPLCTPCNSRKGPRPDEYWSSRFYWDQRPNLSAFRAAQRSVHDTLVHDPITSEWFSQSMSYIAGRIYTLGWVVGAGKTLGIPAVAFGMNHLLRHRWGAVRRADRILVLTKEQAIRDQLADDLRQDLTRFEIAASPPRVATVERGESLDDDVWLDSHDVLVSCVQAIWSRNGERRRNLAGILDMFPLIFVDEPHFGKEQVRDIIDTAYRSVVFGLTGSPLEANGKLLKDFVLLSPFTYRDAVIHDRSLKYLSDRQPERARFVQEIRVEAVDLLAGGENRHVLGTGDEDYDVNQLKPAENVVEGVIRHMEDCDRETLMALGGGLLAPHRLEDAVADLIYPVHGLISCVDINLARRLCELANKFFEANRSRYPLEGGWQAEVIHCGSVDGDDWISAQRLKPEHPWMRAKQLFDEEGMRFGVDGKCARLLFVVGMAREGVNNPLCGVVGVTGPSRSILETVQRTIGRQLRAPTHEVDGLLHVPPALLDTARIIAHEANRSSEAIDAGVAFVCNMEEQLAKLPTISDLVDGSVVGEVAEQPESRLPLKDRLEVARLVTECFTADDLIHQPWRNDPEVMQKFVERAASDLGITEGPKVQRIREWAATLLEDPTAAWRRVVAKDELRDLPVIATVIREDERHEPNTHELVDFIRRHEPGLAEFANSTSAEAMAFKRTLYRNWAEQFVLPPVPSRTKIEDIRRGLVRKVRDTLGPYLVGDPRQIKGTIHGLVGAAVRHVLYVPDGEKAANDSRWDIPQCHVILQRQDVQQDITSWVRGQVIRAGYCPVLAAAFNVGGR